MASSQIQKQVLRQKISAQQIQLARMLLKSVTEMRQAITEETEKNIMLEEVPAEFEDHSPETEEEFSGNEDFSDGEEDTLRDTTEGASEEDIKEFVEDEEGDSAREREERDPNAKETNWDARSEDDSLADQLLQQLRLQKLDSRTMTIAEEIIGNIDASGYLGRDIAIIANDLGYLRDIDVMPDEAERVLGIIQLLDPAGVGARDLKECLLLQLQRFPESDPVSGCAIQIVERYLDEFAKDNLEYIQAQLAIDDNLMANAVERIRHLNGTPGIVAENSASSPSIVPDFYVNAVDGEIVVTLNNEYLPQLRINKDYTEMAKDWEKSSIPNDSDGLKFIKAMTEEAQQFIDLIELRKQTLYLILQTIIQRQRKYFLTGNREDLQPMLQKEIAEETGLDEATVSRIVNNKYIKTDFGTIALKEAFPKSVVNDQGESVATDKVLNLIKQFVDNEDKHNPLSDERLTDLLKAKGFTLARRTVSKYRDSIGIPTCRMRKLIKAVVALILCLSGFQMMAQQPMSYFDSLHYAKIQKARPQRATATAKPQESAPQKAVAPSISESPATEELADKITLDGIATPSLMWYGPNFSGSRVRVKELCFDSLPDEVNLRLVQSDSEFCFPVKNIITSPYGWRMRWNRPHRGVDIRLNTGDPVHCAFNGVVRIARPMGAYGNLVVVRHYNGLETVYGHLSKIKVRPHQQVKAGDVLGLGGSTGHSTGPHLHFEVRFQYEAFDPEWILDFKTYTLRTRKLHLDKTYFGITKPRGRESLAYKADKSIIKEMPIREKKVPKPVYYEVKKGDTLQRIATRYSTTTDKIRSLNTPWQKIYPGQQLRVR